MSNFHNASRRWFVGWVLLLIALPASRYCIHHRELVATAAFDAAETIRSDNCRAFENQVNEFASQFDKSNFRYPSVAELEQRFNGGKALPHNPNFFGTLQLVDPANGATASLYVSAGLYDGASSGYWLTFRNSHLESNISIITVWICRAGCVLLVTICSWSWFWRSELSPARTAALGWRIAGLAVVVFELSWLASTRFPSVDLQLQLNSVCAEPIVPILVFFWLPAFCLRDFPLDLAMRCTKCDYNLKKNISGICPECGTPIPTPICRTVKNTATNFEQD